MRRINQLLTQAAAALENAGVENAGYDARLIFEHISGITKKTQITERIECVSDETAGEFEKLISERAGGRPLQYILGEWYFCDIPFSVGEGVLCPRPETEMLVDEADEYIRGLEKPVIADLCAGTGCIGLTLALHNKNAEVILIEKSPEAFSYLEKNAAKLNLPNVRLVCGGIEQGAAHFGIDTLDVIVSNPPYIASAEIPFLQKEVGREPVTALDGGKDGLEYYRIINEKWLSSLRIGGLIALECGEDQPDEIKKILSGACSHIMTHKDFNNLPRTVTANYRGE
ncbi:MAG: peptide chain release factor N(5)-glutamine methyltransferase [Clostridia bacterium]|nr:peptide chain release factor N(5)-glutamine methyltransferase [Clostridia bacterium]